MTYRFHDVAHQTLQGAVKAALLDWYTSDGETPSQSLANLRADAHKAWHEILSDMDAAFCEPEHAWTRDVDWGTYRAARNEVLAQLAHEAAQLADAAHA